MSHKRTDIRNALKALLEGQTAAQDRVYTNRVFTSNKEKLPLISIHDDAESSTPTVLNSPRYQRKLSLKLILIVTASTNYDTQLDDLCKQVEDIIAANRSIGGTCSGSILQSTEFDFQAGEKPIGQATLTYEITYQT